ncbi:MAG: hypothetical protein ACLFWF_08960 [Alphaproteobacteria bacterium]
MVPIRMNRLVLLAVCVTPAAVYYVLTQILLMNFGIGEGVSAYMGNVAANFLGAIGISAIIYVALEFFRPERPAQGQLIMAAAIAVMILALREFSQISTGGTFDVNDLLWTVLGGGAFYGVGHWMILSREEDEPVAD